MEYSVRVKGTLQLGEVPPGANLGDFVAYQLKDNAFDFTVEGSSPSEVAQRLLEVRDSLRFSLIEEVWVAVPDEGHDVFGPDGGFLRKEPGA